jgi:hypothetical protein
MRYPQGGGLTPQGQAARERVRMLAADGFRRAWSAAQRPADGVSGDSTVLIVEDLLESLGETAWKESGLGASADIDQLQRRITLR